jgi:glycosyltransferase involved in cell wall biosynthesis
MPDISIVIPAFREGAHLPESLALIADVLRRNELDFELLVVDDGSDDDSWSTLCKISAEIRELRAISFTRNFGKEAAIAAGLAHAGGKAVVVMDADLQHPPDLIPAMVRLWQEQDCEIVNAVKRDRGKESAWNRFAATAFYDLFAKLTGLQLKNGSDFKLLDRKVVNTYCNLPERQLFFRGIITWFGYRQCSIPFQVEHRTAGTAKWSTMARGLLAANAFTSFSAFPLQFVTLAGLFTMVFGFGLGLQTLYVWMSGSAVEGFTTVILLLLVIGAVLMISLGIIGQYLAKIYDELKSRPRYLIARQLGFDTTLQKPRTDEGPV